MKKLILQNWLTKWMVVLLLPISVGGSPTVDPYEEVNEDWDRFGAVYGRILDYYYADLYHVDIMRAAIDGMLKELDTYSQFYDAEGLRQLRQDTTGKFEGLGITVAIKDHYPVIIAPIEGSPAFKAGLLPGDLIVAVEDKDTYDLSLEEVVAILRGEPGSTVRIRVANRAGAPSRELKIVRETITIKSVALIEVLDHDIGYISLRQTRFSEYTAAEVEEALEELKKRNVAGLVLDLRGNPGGLLSQATRVADLFLPKDVAIVSIRERNGKQEEVRYSQRKPVAGDLPLVVLIDEGSASASEIVAGAIQDNDRGIIIGTTSFGKGSVQTIFDLHETRDSALKLTTALYYTPSGRSIHRASPVTSRSLFSEVSFSGIKLPAGAVLDLVVKAEDLNQAKVALRARFGLEETDVEQILSVPLSSLVGPAARGEDVDLGGDAVKGERTSFYTTKKREVFGGGGINPDIEVAADNLPGYVMDLNRRRLFFDFVVDYVSADSSLMEAEEVPDIDEEMVEAFCQYLIEKADKNEFYRPGQQELEALTELVDELEWSSTVQQMIAALEERLREDFTQDLRAKLMPYITTALKRELTLRLKGRNASLRAELENDIPLDAAIDLLIDKRHYTQLLQEGAS